MAAVQTTTPNGVDFTLLDDVEPGDVLRIQLTQDSIDDVASLLMMIEGGILTSSDETALRRIMGSCNWGGTQNHDVTIVPTATFDPSWFKGRLAGRINSLEITSRKRPLVDTSVLNQPSASIRYRFSANGWEGAAAILDLHDLEMLELGAADLLRSACNAGQWGTHPRGGHFTNRLAGNNLSEYRGYFIGHVAPHLEFLRP